MSLNDYGGQAFDNEDTLKGKYLIFSVGNELYGLEIKHITEIIGIQPITEVPEMPDYVKGIINLRGKIIAVMDARHRFKKEPKDYDERTCIIVLDIDGTSVGIIVDNVDEVLTLQDEDIAMPPKIGSGRNYVQGIGKAGDGVRLLLDSQKLLTEDELVSVTAISEMEGA